MKKEIPTHVLLMILVSAVTLLIIAFASTADAAKVMAEGNFGRDAVILASVAGLSTVIFESMRWLWCAYRDIEDEQKSAKEWARCAYYHVSDKHRADRWEDHFDAMVDAGFEAWWESEHNG